MDLKITKTLVIPSNEIKSQKIRLEDAFKAQLKHLEEREKEVKKELKALSASKDK